MNKILYLFSYFLFLLVNKLYLHNWIIWILIIYHKLHFYFPFSETIFILLESSLKRYIYTSWQYNGYCDFHLGTIFKWMGVPRCRLLPSILLHNMRLTYWEYHYLLIRRSIISLQSQRAITSYLKGKQLFYFTQLCWDDGFPHHNVGVLHTFSSQPCFVMATLYLCIVMATQYYPVRW